MIFFRQENDLKMSTIQFPNTMFRNTAEFITIVKKLFWSCNTNKTRFGYKRRGIMQAFPALCTYYDKFFYNNEDLSVALQQEDQILSNSFTQSGSTLGHWSAFDSLEELFTRSRMSLDEFTDFQSAVMTYCKANLVKINAYIPSPYVTTYKTDEVGGYDLGVLPSSGTANVRLS